jgi:hypothetical protein
MTTALEELRAADPLDENDVARWRLAASLALAPTPVVPAAYPRRGRTTTVALAVAAVSGVGVGVGVAAAAGLLGEPAPPSVQRHIAGVDDGMPADLRYNPDVVNAREVASTEHGTLYLAHLSDGGYCIEITSGAVQPRGAACVSAATIPALPLEVNAPIPPDPDGPLLIGGVATGADIATVALRYADGTTTEVPFGLEHAWLAEVPSEQQASALAEGVTVLGVASDGTVVERAKVPPLRDEDPTGTAHDAEQPIVVDTVSDSADLEVIRAIRGRVNIAGTTLTLRYPNGDTTNIPLASDGGFNFTVPVARQHDFARRPGILLVRVRGDVVATQPVESVAGWRATHG